MHQRAKLSALAAMGKGRVSTRASCPGLPAQGAHTHGGHRDSPGPLDPSEVSSEIRVVC